MREILFKAKRVDNGEWIEGYYVFDKDDNLGIIVSYIDYQVVTTFAVGGTRVLTETVCQYIGITDWNDKKIFIGDILKGGHGNYIIVPARNGWQLKRLKNNGEIGTNSTAAYLHLYEIIGNIHDKE